MLLPNVSIPELGPLGTCCECGRNDASDIGMMNRACPGPATNCWICSVCGAPGAIVVLCEECSKKMPDPPKFACVGHPAMNVRIPFCDLKPFQHDLTKHPSTPDEVPTEIRVASVEAVAGPAGLIDQMIQAIFGDIDLEELRLQFEERRKLRARHARN